MRHCDQIQAGNAREVGTEASVLSLTEGERPANAGFSEVGVDEQRFISELGQGDGQVCGRGRLTLARQRARNQDYLGRVIRLGEQKRRAEGTECFRHLRLRQVVRDQLDASFAPVCRGRQSAQEAAPAVPSIGVDERGHNREGRQPRQHLHIIGRFNRVIHVLAQEGKADSPDKPDQKSQRDIAHFGGPRRRRGNHRRVDYSNVRRTQAGGDPRFFQFCEQSFIECLVGFGFTLEDVVLHEALCHLVGFRLLLIKSLEQEQLALARRAVFIFDACDDVFLFRVDQPIEFLELLLEALHAREVGPELIESRSVLGVGVVAFLVDVLKQLAVAHGREGVQAAGLGELIERLLLHAVALRLGQLLIDFPEPLGSNALLVVNRPDLVLALVGDARVLGLFHADLQLVELVGKPGGSLGGGFVAAAEIVFDEILDVRVDDAGGQPRVRGLKSHIQERAVGHAFHREAAEKGSELRRPVLIGQAAGSHGFGGFPSLGKIGMAGETDAPDRLQGESLAGEYFGLRLDIVFLVQQIGVRVRRLERQEVCIFPVDFDSRGGYIDGFHTKGRDGNNRHHSQEKS